MNSLFYSKMTSFCKKVKNILFRRLCANGAKLGQSCCINHFSRFTKNTTVGADCHFNGMRISGCGNVNIGDHFHSGRDCIIIAFKHDYDGGDKLPYADVDIPLDVSIEKNVWIGDSVIILGGYQ